MARQLRGERLLGNRDAEFLEDPWRVSIEQRHAGFVLDALGAGTLHDDDGGWLAGDPFIAVGAASLRCSTQSRMIYSPTPPIFAASVRAAPS